MGGLSNTWRPIAAQAEYFAFGGYNRGTTDLYPSRQRKSHEYKLLCPRVVGLAARPRAATSTKHALSMLNCSRLAAAGIALWGA